MKYIFTLTFCAIGFLSQAQLKLNEACSGNGTIIKDEAGTYQDYAELYNMGSTAVNLKGFQLIDDRSKAATSWYTFPDTSIAPGGFLLIWCDGKGKLATTFGLGKGGDSLNLLDASGNLVDQVVIPSLPTDSVFHRDPDGSGTWKITSKATPGTRNIPLLPNGIESLQVASFAYPNPANQSIYIHLEQPMQVYWTDLSGKKVGIMVSAQNGMIETPENSGLYLLHCLSKEGYKVQKVEVIR